MGHPDFIGFLKEGIMGHLGLVLSVEVLIWVPIVACVKDKSDLVPSYKCLALTFNM